MTLYERRPFLPILRREAIAEREDCTRTIDVADRLCWLDGWQCSVVKEKTRALDIGCAVGMPHLP